MPNKITFLLIILGSFLMSQNSEAQLSEAGEISVLTCRQGDDVYNMFGHTTIWINDPTFQINELYNYGIFEFKPGFAQKFLRGKLNYKLGKQSYNNFLRNYTNEKRSVIAQQLNLTPEQKNNIYRDLRENYKPENREYLYDFFFDNCSTRPRDILEKNIPNLVYPENYEKITHRNLIDKFSFSSPWTDFGMDLIIGARTDRKTTQREQMFLPEILFDILEKSTNNGEALVKNTQIVLDFEKEAQERKSIPFVNPTLVFGLILLLELFLFWQRKKGRYHKFIKYYDGLWYLLLGIGGIVMLFMWFATDHSVCVNNFNLLWMNLLFFIPSLRSSKTGVLILIGCLVAALLCNLGIQEMHIASILIIVTTLLKLISNYMFPSDVE